ncbi:hypothetical protein V491_03138 [Pseudogymnoascus sp. VKM F-3775]|nr:hypothetical protein V491_03138 [Pseudogymnoascus sp. VKM F-3775]
MVSSNNTVSAAISALDEEILDKTRILGPEHPDTLSSMFRRGQALEDEGKEQLALQAFQHLLPLRERVLGPDNPDTVLTLDLICRQLCLLLQFDEALRLLQKKLQQYEETLGRDNYASICVLRNMGDIYKLDEKPQEATMMYQAAFECSERGLGPQHKLTIEIQRDHREMKPEPLSLGQVQAIAAYHDLPIPGEPFPDAKTLSFAQLVSRYTKVTGVISSTNPEVHSMVALRLAEMGQSPAKPVKTIPSWNEAFARPADRVNPLNHGNSDGNSDPFSALVNRSIAAWRVVADNGESDPRIEQAIKKHVLILSGIRDLDELLRHDGPQFWFFQLREVFISQDKFHRWDPNRLADYILLPMEDGFVNPRDCIFLSHYWRTPDHPDPKGEDLTVLQKRMGEGEWTSSYVWVDWTCVPQRERTEVQRQYFKRTLQTIAKLVRDCSFLWTFPQFEPRLWVLCEVAEYATSRPRTLPLADVQQFMAHLSDMMRAGVRPVLNKQGYKCTNQGDLEQVLAWLDILVTLNKTVPSMRVRRQILNTINDPMVQTCLHSEAGVAVDKRRGTIIANGKTYTFNPAPFAVLPSAYGAHVQIEGSYDAELSRAMSRMNALINEDEHGGEELAREYDLEGEHKIAEAIHRLVLKYKEQVWRSDSSDVIVTIHELAENLDKQGRYAEAEEYYGRLVKMSRKANGRKDDLTLMSEESLAAVRQKRELLELYSLWGTTSLESILHMKRPDLLTDEDSLSLDAGRFIMMRQKAHELRDAGQLYQSWGLLWHIVDKMKETLGPYHIKTQHAIWTLTRVLLMDNKAKASQALGRFAFAVSDYTLGPQHPDTLATMGHLAASTKSETQTKELYRQQLERMLGWMDWGDPDLFAVKYNLEGSMRANEELRIEMRLGPMGSNIPVVRIHRKRKSLFGFLQLR